MKFYSEPNHTVTKREVNKITKRATLKVLFKFDEQGEYTTTDTKLIEKLKQHFRYEEEVKETKLTKKDGAK